MHSINKGLDAMALGTNMNYLENISKLKSGVTVLDHGYVKLISWEGDDAKICEVARTSYAGTKAKRRSDKNLIQYLLRHDHTSPFEHNAITFEVKMPIFVARQIMRQRMFKYNEISGRYVELPDDVYCPSIEAISGKSKTNKQGRDESNSQLLSDEVKHEMQLIMKTSFESSKRAYKALIDSGLAPELARIVLPAAQYTVVVISMDLNNAMRFLSKRLASYAQYETREYAKVIYAALQLLFPEAMLAFKKYRLNSVSFTEEQATLIGSALKGNEFKLKTIDDTWKISGSDGEKQEFGELMNRFIK